MLEHWDERWWQHRGNTSDIISVSSVHHRSWCYVTPRRDKRELQCWRGGALAIQAPMLRHRSLPRFCLLSFLRLGAHHHLRRQGLVMCLIQAETGRCITSTHACVSPCVCVQTAVNLFLVRTCGCALSWEALHYAWSSSWARASEVYLPEFGPLWCHHFAKCVDTWGGMTTDKTDVEFCFFICRYLLLLR